MNTVDALKDLYKTLCGKDYAGDPNPTDAEMISAIAKDASSGGDSGSGGGRIIELTPGSSQGTFLPIEPNLPIEYFAGACIGIGGQYFTIKIVQEEYDGQGNVNGCEFVIETPAGNTIIVYFSSDGSIAVAD